MNSESKEEKEQLEIETINLNEFFNLIINLLSSKNKDNH